MFDGEKKDKERSKGQGQTNTWGGGGKKERQRGKKMQCNWAVEIFKPEIFLSHLEKYQSDSFLAGLGIAEPILTSSFSCGKSLKEVRETVLKNLRRKLSRSDIELVKNSCS